MTPAPGSGVCVLSSGSGDDSHQVSLLLAIASKTEIFVVLSHRGDSGLLLAVRQWPLTCPLPPHDTWVDRLPLQIPAEHKGQGSVVTLEDTEVASRWPSGRLRRRQRAGRSVGHRISQWGRPRLLRHVNILLILPTSFSPRGRFCCFLRCSGRCRSTWSPRASLCGHGRPWSGDTKCDWMLGRVP